MCILSQTCIATGSVAREWDPATPSHAKSLNPCPCQFLGSPQPSTTFAGLIMPPALCNPIKKSLLSMTTDSLSSPAHISILHLIAV